MQVGFAVPLCEWEEGSQTAAGRANGNGYKNKKVLQERAKDVTAFVTMD